ncbi:MAG: DUF58 domain-containing protein [Verrucomicrobia bacterium]|nr:DUF58 domain-containing protein [Verrucomicrobiota bacterium]
MSPAAPTPAADPYAPHSAAFLRLLYRAYFHNSGLGHLLMRRVCPAGLGLAVVLMLAGVLGVGQPRQSVFELFALACGMGMLGLPLVLMRRASVAASREVPRHGTVGEPLRYTLRVTNTGRRRLRRAWLAETQPDARPGLTEFSFLREPGEEERNWFDRTFAYYRWQWLMSRKRLFSGGVPPDEIKLAPGGHVTVTVTIIPQRRGVIRLNDLRVLLPDPLTLFQRCRKVAAPPATITVLPQRWPLPPSQVPGSARFQIGGEVTGNAIGNAGEFVGLRDYREGDPWRQIHWKSWARTGRPIVKELEDTCYPRYGLVLDTFPAAGAGAVFEEAVSVAASFAATLDTRESLLDLMFIKDEAHHVTAGRGLARAEKLLEVLAAVEPEADADFDTLARLVLRHRDELTSCLVIFAGWDESRAALLRTLVRGGITCAPIIIGHGPPPVGIPGHWIESGQLARDLRRLPARLGQPF